MKSGIVVDHLTRSLAIGVMALSSVASALADSGPAPHTVTIAVLDDRYIVGDLAFDDLDYLERQITATNLRNLELLICGPNATRALKAIVHRFRHVPVQMRVPDIDEFECMSKAPVVTPVRQRVGERPFGIDDEAVERYWLDIMP
jgi:hypothetical protein